VSYKTAIILCIVLIGGMFVLPAFGASLANHYAEQGLYLPLYLRIYFGICAFLLSFRFFLIPPIIAGLFLTAALTGKSGRRA
jgi:hypothetical protein